MATTAESCLATLLPTLELWQGQLHGVCVCSVVTLFTNFWKFDNSSHHPDHLVTPRREWQLPPTGHKVTLHLSLITIKPETVGS